MKRKPHSLSAPFASFAGTGSPPEESKLSGLLRPGCQASALDQGSRLEALKSTEASRSERSEFRKCVPVAFYVLKSTEASQAGNRIRRSLVV